ncbi:dihydroxy-acid dehydratase [Nostoc sp. NIES-4103]|nr:dihydroxy-acid dehydratase [Nostoc sp. NIES-4103]
MPGAMLAIARMNIPGIFVYGGTIKPGNYNLSWGTLRERGLTQNQQFQTHGGG